MRACHEHGTRRKTDFDEECSGDGRVSDTTPLADGADAVRRRPAGLSPLQGIRRRPGRDSRRPQRNAGAGRRDPPAARPERAALDPVLDFPEADRHLRLGPQLGDQRVGRPSVRDAPAGDADRDGADPRARHPSRDPVRARRRLRAGLAHRPHDHGRDDGGALDLVPGLRDRRPVRVRVPARPLPGAGLERQRRHQPARVRAAAGAARGGGLAGADDAPVPHLLPRRDRPRLRAHRARQGNDRARRPAQARAAQRADPDPHQRRGRPAGHLRRLVPDRGVLLDPRPRPRDPARRQPQRLPRHPGVRDLHRRHHHGRQPR